MHKIGANSYTRRLLRTMGSFMLFDFYFHEQTANVYVCILIKNEIRPKKSVEKCLFSPRPPSRLRTMKRRINGGGVYVIRIGVLQIIGPIPANEI